MDNYIFNIVWNDGEPVSVTAYYDGEHLTASTDHPRFDEIRNEIGTQFATGNQGRSAFETLRNLFDTGAAISKKFERLSERVLVKNGQIYFDGEVMHGVLVDTIVRFHEQRNEDFRPLVAFLEKIEQNPNPHSREHLFRWLQLKSFSLTDDGDFVAYKGIQNDDLSITSGTAIVDGEQITGQIPNKPGSVIEMPRGEVQFDPAVACSTGLHAGNWSYARGFGPKVVMVRINPRDVVSVPTDSNDQKLRVCRYVVLNEVTQPADGLLLKDTILPSVHVVQPHFVDPPLPDPPLADDDDFEDEDDDDDEPGYGYDPTQDEPDEVPYPAWMEEATSDEAERDSERFDPEDRAAIDALKFQEEQVRAVLPTIQVHLDALKARADQVRQEHLDRLKEQAQAVEDLTKGAKATKAKKATKRPQPPAPTPYDGFRLADFADLSHSELRGAAKVLGLKGLGNSPKREVLAKACAQETRRRRKNRRTK